MNKDLRHFLHFMEENHPAEFVRLKKPVDTKWELSALMHKLQSKQRWPVLLFENVKGHSMPVVANLFATRRLLAHAVGTTVDGWLQKTSTCFENPIKPKMVATGPVKDVVMTGDLVDLGKLPIVWHCEKDAGPFICPGMTVMKDPDTGVRNVGVYRHQLYDRNHLGLFIIGLSHGWTICQKAEDRGQDLEVAIVLGHHPAVVIGSQWVGSIDVDEFEMAGALLGEPLELVKCETVDLEVPAYAEIVIEGKVLAGQLRDEAPFGEGTGYYGKMRQSPIIEVTAITHRKDAIFHDLYNLGTEHGLLAEAGREPAVFRTVKSLVPQLIAVRYPDITRFVCYVKIKKEYDGLGKNAALATLAAEGRIAIAIVVDEEVDIYNDNEILWALATRCDPGRSFFFVNDAGVCNLDPSSYDLRGQLQGGLKTKVGIDATKPVGIPFSERAMPPKDMVEGLRLEDYLPPGLI